MALRKGGCHCRNIEIEFETELASADMQPRACQCSFCRKHQSRAVSDPNGHLNIRVKDADKLSRYRFSLGTIDFLVCRDCGVYVAAVMPDPTDSEAYATLMISALDDREGFPLPESKDYDEQDAQARANRRRSVWTPAVLQIAS